MQFQIVAILADVDVHEQRLAGAGGASEGQLPQIIRHELFELVALGLVRVEPGKVVVQVVQQLIGGRKNTGLDKFP